MRRKKLFSVRLLTPFFRLLASNFLLHSAVRPHRLFMPASAAGAGRRGLHFLFLFRGQRRLLIALCFACRFLGCLFLGADRTLLVAASAAASAHTVMLFSANCTVALRASAAAAESDAAAHRHAAQQPGDAHACQNLLHFFFIHLFLLLVIISERVRAVYPTGPLPRYS